MSGVFDDLEDWMKRVNDAADKSKVSNAQIAQEQEQSKEEKDDYNKYYRDQIIAEENQRYTPGNGGNGDRKSGTTRTTTKTTKAKSEEAQKITSKSQVYKLGDHFLAEAILIGERNQPYWITSESRTNQVSVQQFIDISDDLDGKQKKLLYAPKRTLYLNEPYVFGSIEQANQLIQDVKANETPETLFNKIRSQWKKYVSESDNHINLCCGDCVFIFFQDRLGTTHYLFFVADTEAGKSSNLFMFKYLAYRAFLAIDISIANIYRFYGNEFEGIGTLLEDEIDDLDQQPEKLRMYKSGYTKGLKVPKSEKVGDSQGYEQEGYNVFGFKAFAAEKMPFSHKAKGFRERTIEMPCSFGLPQYDIQEIVNDADDPKHKALLAELNELRNRLLIYRLLHYHDPIPDIEIDLQAREKQLWKPLLRVFQNSTKALDILKQVVSEYIKEYREQKSHTHTAFLLRMVSDLITKNKSHTLSTSDIWNEYMARLPDGELIGKTSYTSPEYGDMSQKRLNELLRDQFKARPPRHTRNVRELVFDKTALDRMKQKYRINIKNKDETDETDETDVGLDRHLPEQHTDTKTSKNTEENTNNSSKNEQTDTNYSQQNEDKASLYSNNPSHVSHVSPNSSNTIDTNKHTEQPLQQLTPEQIQMIEALGNYGTYRCKYCDYKDDKEGMFRHMLDYHSSTGKSREDVDK